MSVEPYANAGLPLPRWFPETSPRDGMETWHRWGAIPGMGGGVWGWDRWCRTQVQPFGMSGGAESPPANVRVCRGCKAKNPKWWRPMMGDVFAGLFSVEG